MKTISYIDDMDTWRSEFSFNIPVKVRFSETDMYGHVNNVSPFIYFEEARIDYIRSLGILLDMNNNEQGIIVADLQCDYLQQIYFTDMLRVYVKTAAVGNTSFDLHYMVVKGDGEIALTGRGRVVYINPEQGRPIPLTEEMKKLLLK
ncbi:acyl-CoA thioesterase [Oceanobacillus massiliensis]|uniref:acyl-CoA thioesterase n=1 Tax=Oceanobacillus massiliensis TaxID=1465765 RepID=UPI000289E02A|nr:thioesterase family protein [Oceanobacillus massiliensis]